MVGMAFSLNLLFRNWSSFGGVVGAGGMPFAIATVKNRYCRLNYNDIVYP